MMPTLTPTTIQRMKPPMASWTVTGKLDLIRW